MAENERDLKAQKKLSIMSCQFRGAKYTSKVSCDSHDANILWMKYLALLSKLRIGKIGFSSLLFCEWNVEACINNRSGTQSHVSDRQQSSVKSHHPVALTSCDLLEWNFMNEIDSLEGTASSDDRQSYKFLMEDFSNFYEFSTRLNFTILNFPIFFRFYIEFRFTFTGLVFLCFWQGKSSRTSAIYIEFVGHISAILEWTAKKLVSLRHEQVFVGGDENFNEWKLAAFFGKGNKAAKTSAHNTKHLSLPITGFSLVFLLRLTSSKLPNFPLRIFHPCSFSPSTLHSAGCRYAEEKDEWNEERVSGWWKVGWDERKKIFFQFLFALSCCGCPLFGKTPKERTRSDWSLCTMQGWDELKMELILRGYDAVYVKDQKFSMQIYHSREDDKSLSY